MLDPIHKLYRHATDTPHRQAVNVPHRAPLTFAQFYAQIVAQSESFTSVLDKQQETIARIALLCHDPLAMLTSFYAIQHVGASAVILDPAWPQARITEVLGEVPVVAVLTDAERNVFPEVLPVHRAITAPAEESDELTTPTSVDDAAELMVIFTSGSTSMPKPIARSRSSWALSLPLGFDVLGASESARSLIPGPLAHGLSLYAAVEALSAGGSVWLSGGWKLDCIRMWLNSDECNRMVAVPSAYQKLLDTEGPRLMAAIETIVSGGEALGATLISRLASLPNLKQLTEYYGTSEHGFIAYHHHDVASTAPAVERTGFAGRLFPGVQARVSFPATVDGPGALLVRSPLTATGYLGQSARQWLETDGWIGVGDHGYLDGQSLYLQGRGGDMIQWHGNNIYPTEVEHELCTILGTADCRVVDLHAAGQRRLVAFVEAGSLPDVPLDALEQLRQRLPKYKIPHLLSAVARWPRTNSGKIQRAALPDAFDLERTVALRK
ncbi:AMP-binding protein [Glutamicibacter sp. PS]|uniref:class I adenylate-forming enzyme family protein n=1 Tax=Glutamicibacter sp. PS TaxID=3075634 RepID=UPI0028528001|nr:AMP-binding protein [Glutamicibacter sp. PS]